MRLIIFLFCLPISIFGCAKIRYVEDDTTMNPLADISTITSFDTTELQIADVLSTDSSIPDEPSDDVSVNPDEEILTTESTTTMSGQYTYNCTNGALRFRKPTLNNNLTSHWCIGIADPAKLPETSGCECAGYKRICKTQFGENAVYTAPENRCELKSAVRILNQIQKSSTSRVLAIDGWLRKGCKPIGKCSPSTSFIFADGHTDPTFIMNNNWLEDQPDNRTSRNRTKNCLGIDEIGRIRNIFCYKPESTIRNANREPEYVIQGVMCGWPATKSEIL